MNYGAGEGPYSICAGDLDGDNDLDLAVANTYSATVSVLLGNGDGTYTGAVDYAGHGGYPKSLCAGDLDGDGDLDLALASRVLDDVSVLMNLSDEITGVEVDPRVSHVAPLLTSYPNPFNPTTTISFYLPERAHANLSIYNLEGKLVKTLIDGVMNEGYKRTTWDGTDSMGNPVSSGVYFCRLKSGKKVLAKKMVLIK